MLKATFLTKYTYRINDITRDEAERIANRIITSYQLPITIDVWYDAIKIYEFDNRNKSNIIEKKFSDSFFKNFLFTTDTAITPKTLEKLLKLYLSFDRGLPNQFINVKICY